MNPAIIFAVLVALLASFIATQKSATVSKVSDETLGSGAFFNSIADRYDVLNRIISLGHDSQWRHSALDAIRGSRSVLDVSTGTADLAIAVAATMDARVVGVDPSDGMLTRGREKVELLGLGKTVRLVDGVAEQLPFEPEEFEAVVVAFGVRNFQNRKRGIREMIRVLAPGGKLAILELSMPRGDGALPVVARFFVNRVMPSVASLVTGNPSAYRYLSSSMDAFPGSDEFVQILQEAGVEHITHKRLAPFGLGPDLYVATKPELPEAVAESSGV